MEYVASTCLDPVVEPWHLPAYVHAGDAEAAEAAPPAPAAAGPEGRMRPLDEEVRELERARIAEALRRAGGVQTRAAELLSMPLRTFTGKVKQYGLTALANTRPRPPGDG